MQESATKPLLMHRGPDGTFTAEIKTTSDSIRYEVVGISRNGHTVNGTDATRYSIDKSGDYWSILYPVNGRVRVVFDPTKLVRSGLPVNVSFVDSQSTAARFAAIYDEIRAEASAFSSAVNAYRKSGKDIRAFRYDWSKEVRKLQKRIDSGENGIVREGLLFNYLDLMSMGAEENYKLIETALNEIPASSAIWSLKPELYELMLKDYGISRDDYDQYIDKFIGENSSAIAKSAILFEEFLTAKYMNEEGKTEKYYNLLTERYAGTPYGKRAREDYSPVNKVRIGAPVPAFKIALLTDSSKTYTNNSFKGKYYLIDFWATWCGPCVAEMQYLQKAYERFKGKDFAMLSVSIDASSQDVANFRKEKWPMPWDQAFAECGWNNKMLRDFGVVAIPNPVLVDPSGKVVAMGFQLRALELEATLGGFLEKGKK